MNLWYNRVCIRSSFLLEIADAETVSDMKGQKKTNAARILDGLSISYELREFPVDLDDLSAVHAAEMLHMPVEQVFKTLVARTDKAGVVMACIPGAAELDLKALAKAAASKKAEMVHLKEVLALTAARRSARRRSILCSSTLRRKRGTRLPSARAGAANRSCSRPPIWSVPSMRRRHS